MGRKKGKKGGNAQDEGPSSSSQQKSQQESSRQQPSKDQTKPQQASGPQQQRNPPAPVSQEVRTSPSHSSSSGRGQGRGYPSQQTQRIPQVGAQPRQDPQQEQGGPRRQGTQQGAPVQQPPWGPQQTTAQPVASSPQQKTPWGQSSQQYASSVQPQPGISSQQPITQQAASSQQRAAWGQSRQQSAPQQHMQSPPPQQYAPMGQPSPQSGLTRPQQVQSPPGITQKGQPQIGSGGRGDFRENIPAVPVSSIKQEPQPVQQPKGPQKGKKKGSQQQGPQQAASSSQKSPTEQVSKLQISKTEVGGGGDAQLLPIEYIRAKPGVKCRKKIIVETNHLSLNLGKLETAVHYDVNIVPDIPKNSLRNVVEVFRRKHFGNRYPAFDGRKNLYSTNLLPFKDFIADEVVLQEQDGRERKYKVEIKFANYVDLTPLHDLLKSKETPREAMQVVDIVLRSAPAALCIPAGRSYFVKPPNMIDLGEGMQMYNGFYQSAIRGWKPFLNVDVAHKAFPKSINLIEVIEDLFSTPFRKFERSELVGQLKPYQSKDLSKFISTLKVYYEIPGHPSTRKIYTVHGLGDPPSTSKFKLENGEVTTIEKYFAKNKNYKLRYPNLPSLWVGNKQRENKILLPLELCTVVENQVKNRKMTENQTSAMIKYAATSTSVRKEKIITSLNQARHNTHPSVKEFGFSIANSFEQLEARVLYPPKLAYKAGSTVEPFKGVWRGGQFVHGAIIKRWTIASVLPRPPRPDELGRLAEMIFRNGTSSGMIIETQPEKPFANVQWREIRNYFQQQKGKFDVIFVIVPNSGPEYSYVKKAAELSVGCLTQCIKMRTLGKMNPQTAINILLKVNSKLNGTNHHLRELPPIMKTKRCIIMGADVTHPSPEARDIPSVAAVTASHDTHAFQYNICWRLQPPKVEIIEDLEAIVKEQLIFYYKSTRQKPESILFFRDGVSEGQFDQVRNAEIRAIRSACKKLQAEGYEPTITFLVVQKRHHTRLFPTDSRDSEDRNMNVPAGTCVDTVITHPFMQDFYLVSHASIQGVARPTKYCTLWDDNEMSNDDIEQLTYYLCHLFTRCNRSVSYPAPTYYAHLAAARAKVYIENETLNLDKLQQEFSRFQILKEIRGDKPMFFV